MGLQLGVIQRSDHNPEHVVIIGRTVERQGWDLGTGLVDVLAMN